MEAQPLIRSFSHTASSCSTLTTHEPMFLADHSPRLNVGITVSFRASPRKAITNSRSSRSETIPAVEEPSDPCLVLPWACVLPIDAGMAQLSMHPSELPAAR